MSEGEREQGRRRPRGRGVALALLFVATLSSGCGASRHLARYSGSGSLEPLEDAVVRWSGDISSLEIDLDRGLGADAILDCGEAGLIRDRICDLADKICAVADRGRVPAERCLDARARCERAKDRVARRCGSSPVG